MSQSNKLMKLQAGAVREAIRRQDLKRYWVAEQAGIHKTTLRRWLSGDIAMVRATNVSRLANVLETDLAALTAREGQA